MDVSFSAWRSGLRIPLILLWTAVLLIPSVTTHVIFGRAWMPAVSLWHRGCCRLLGLEIETFGDRTTARPVLYVANHISYLDILLLGGLLNARFIAKSEVRGWPGIGLLARLAGTIFVDRRAKSRSRQQRDVIQSCLDKGDSLVLFAEGTSSDGSQVLPFKSSLFSVVEAKDGASVVPIQPVTVDYISLRDGRPIEDEQRLLYAWYGDMTLLPHLRQVLGLAGARVRISWHDIIQPTVEVNRKELARQAERAVARGLESRTFPDQGSPAAAVPLPSS